MIKVAIADDHPLVLEGIKKVLANEIDIDIKGAVSNGHDLMGLLKKGLPDIVILDITMPNRSGLEILKDIHHQYSPLPVLILSIHPAERFAVRALKNGARGYLNKSAILEELVKAIHTIVDKKRRYITPEVSEQLAQQMAQHHANGQLPHEMLSDREYEVLRMIAAGNNVKAIAKELSLSSHTVHTYRARIKKKMQLSSNVEMTRYALQHHLIN